MSAFEYLPTFHVLRDIQGDPHRLQSNGGPQLHRGRDKQVAPGPLNILGQTLEIYLSISRENVKNIPMTDPDQTNAFLTERPSLT